jgi:EmrB/QacA subfamily drug resistance transporter
MGQGNRRLALVILCAASLMIILDGTIVTVALPTIQADLGFTAGSLSWVMTAYLIAFGGLLLLGGRLADLLGRKRMFLAGLTVFTVASLACGLAVSPGMLIAARFVQGAGAALVSAVSLGMLVRLFTGPREQARAIGAFAFTGAVGASAGLIAGGLLVQYATWHWIFFVNLPVGLLAGLAAARVLPSDRGIGLGKGADGLGALMVTAGVMLGVFAIARPADWWAGLPAVALLAGFAVRQTALQAAGRAPLLPLRVLASRNVAGANLAQVLIIGAAMGFQVIVTLYMQRALGYSPAEAGLGLFPAAAVIAIVSLGLSARLTIRFGARWLLLAGLVMITAALALLTQVPAHATYASRLLPLLALFGLGAGLTLPSVTSLGMSGATDADSGVLSGLFNTAQQVGAAIGLAVLTTLAASRTGASHTAQALTSGYHLAWAVGAIMAGASFAVAAIALRQPGGPRRQSYSRSAGNQAESATDPLGTRQHAQSTDHGRGGMLRSARSTHGPRGVGGYESAEE